MESDGAVGWCKSVSVCVKLGTGFGLDVGPVRAHGVMRSGRLTRAACALMFDGDGVGVPECVQC